MKRILLPYLIAYVILSAVLLWMFFTHTQTELHLILNSWHTHIGDVFFKYYTHFAEWPLYIIALIPIFFKRYIWTLLYALSEIVGGLIFITVLKKIYELPRPAAVFEKCPDLVLPTVDGVDLHYYDSFPSGHACTFFTFFTMLALICAVRGYKHGVMEKPHSLLVRTLIVIGVFCLLILAVMGAYSRVYLSQHFFIDVYVGSLVGIIVPCIVVYIFRKYLLK